MQHPRSVEEVKQIWRLADAVCFDVDSTVVKEEGLDCLAAYLGRGEEVAALTRQAMGGSLSFREALRTRLDLLRPRAEQLNSFVREHPLTITVGMKDLVDKLRVHGKAVHLVSGGFVQIIAPVAAALGIPEADVFANQLLFDDAGNYAGFDESCPTSESGGKAKVAQLLKDTRGYGRLVFVGDGVTDMEACPPADAFIGFGGHVIREKVKAGAKWFVLDLLELSHELSCPTAGGC